jgi:N-acetylmuramoyl-L-alanine amidase
MHQPILIIDAGHGGKDPGGGSNQHWQEKDLTLKISLYQYKRFLELGIPVVLTREKDISLTPSQRTKIVRESGAKYCISNHINAGGGEGAETIYSLYSNGKLAHNILENLAKIGQITRKAFLKKLFNSIKKDYYYMHRRTGTVETVIIEYGFADNPNDTQRLLKFWNHYAESIVSTFCAYIHHPYTAPKIDNTDNFIDDDLMEALKVLVDENIIESPEYWQKNAKPGSTIQGDYAAILIKRVADRLKSLKD